MLTLFSDSDPITAGGERIFQEKVQGAAGQPHRTITDAGHFLQEDKGPEIANAIADFVGAGPAAYSPLYATAHKRKRYEDVARCRFLAGSIP